MTTRTATLRISGMHCSGCASKISAALLKLDGVETADVSAQNGTATIAGDPLPGDDTLGGAVEAAGDYTMTGVERGSPTSHPESSSHQHHAAIEEPVKESLYPLFLIVGFIAGVTLLIALATGDWSIEPLMRHFMAGFFIVFSFFKLLDPPGFVSAYRGYDLIARKVPAWGWAYPFVELALGVA
ncbi:MAG: cation transporter, partial [Phycisphaerales bacterium]|nr:cation transporter [Phycisphaerales bacterium]